MSALAYITGFWLLFVGAAGIARSRNLVQAVGCLSVAQSGTAVFLVAIGYQHHARPPVFGSPAQHVSTAVVDPVVQAMVLTDIVVGATVTALLLALSLQIAKRARTIDPDELNSVEAE